MNDRDHMLDAGPALSELERRVREKLSADPTGHDFWHVVRVRYIAVELARREGGDCSVVEAAAWLHDLYRPEEKHTGMLHFGPEAQTRMRELLEQVGFPAQKIDAVLQCVAMHENYIFADGGTQASQEAFILQDADRLDAIGAIGIARVFMFSGAHGRVMWNPEEKPQYWSARQPPSGSAIAHFYEKLLKLAEGMNTPTAQKWARTRHRFMEEFLDEFFAEWEGRPSRAGLEEDA